MKNIHQLRAERNGLINKARNLLDGPKYSARVAGEVDELQKRIDALSAQIGQIEKAQALETDLDRDAKALSVKNGLSVDQNATNIVAARGAFRAFLAEGPEKLTERQRQIIRPANVTEGTPSAGGYLVPTILMPNLLKKLKWFGGMRDVATVIETASGGPLAWATTDDTGATGELVAENTSATTGDATFGQVTLSAYKFSSKIIPVSFEVLQDRVVPIEDMLFDMIATRIARGQNIYFTLGTGVIQPQGALTAASIGYQMPTGNTTTIGYDGLMNLMHSLDPAYRSNPKCAFMMRDDGLKQVRLLKDANGRPLYLSAFDGSFGDPTPYDTLFGHRLVINNDLPAPVASGKSVLFGDFSKYLIRDVFQTQIFRFADSPYVSKGQIGFLGWARADGRQIDASNSSIVALQQSAT